MRSLMAVTVTVIFLTGLPAFCEDEPAGAPDGKPAKSRENLAELADLPGNTWRYLRDVADIPHHMDRRDWQRFTIGAAAVGLLAVYDEEIRDYALEREDDSYDDFKVLGEYGYAAGFFLASNLAGWALSDEGLAETGASGLEALVLTAVPTLLVQGITGRKRPDEGGSYEWFSGGHGASGHAAVAFCTVTVLDRRYLTVRDEMSSGQKSLRYAGKLLLYGAAACAALERINDDKHYASDVALGGFFGFLSANFVMNRRAADMRFSFDGETTSVAFVREF